ncbi:MAG: leucine-rich repeat protein [Ruminococcus sp.]|nr:leucine-rich repeat protein [Ruminococcus sp.]
MKLLKRITSTMLSVTIIAGAAATGLSTKVTASAEGTKLMYHTVISEWQSRINAEKSKFPNGYYWNHKGKSSYDENTCTKKPCHHAEDYATGEICCSETRIETGDERGQCYGFAFKLAKDIWGTTEFYKYHVDDNYEPKIGDNVRLEFDVEGWPSWEKQGHSIFITGISGENITFAECNGELQDCMIRWDRTEYYDKLIYEKKWVKDSNGQQIEKTIFKGDPNSVTTVTKSYLREHAKNYFRPVIAGDLNRNGILDSDDAMKFESSIMTNGTKLYETKYSYYDVNGDGYINTSDYNEIRYGSYNLRIVMPDESTDSRWRSLNHSSGFRYYDGCYYVKNNLGGVSWIGSVDSEISTMYVPSRVYCERDKCWYDVTEIGYDAYNRDARVGWRTCTANYKIKTIYLPDTIKSIHSYAFENWPLTSLKFSGSDPQLETISSSAFYNCGSLMTLDLSPAKKLKTVDNFAFEGCGALYHIDLPYTGSVINLGSGNGSIFGNTDPLSATIQIKNPNNSTSPASNYQIINISDKDHDYWANKNLYYYGKLFKLYNGEYYLGQVNTKQGYLRP